MHRSLISMQGLPVISEQGVRLGTVLDAHFDPFEQRIVAFVVDWENDLVRGPDDLLPITQVSELNADIVSVPNELGVASGLDNDFQLYEEGLIPVFEQLLERSVARSGKLLGKVVDLQFDPRDGSVKYYEIAPEGPEEASLMLSPHPELDFQEATLNLPADADLRPHAPEPLVRRGIAFLEEEELVEINEEEEEETVGEEDIEVTRTQSSQPY